MPKFLLLTVALLLVSGCATVWVKPGATGEQLADDKMKCSIYMRSQCGPEGCGWATRSIFHSCMRERGWEEAK